MTKSLEAINRANCLVYRVAHCHYPVENTSNPFGKWSRYKCFQESRDLCHVEVHIGQMEFTPKKLFVEQAPFYIFEDIDILDLIYFSRYP